MPRSIDPVRVNHINMVLEDFDEGIAHFRDLYDADVLADYPQDHWRAGLFAMGGVIFEPFVPNAWLLNARYGPHYLGIEYQADMEQVRGALVDHDIRIARDIGVALHTHPADTLGVAFEFYEGSFHDRVWEPLNGPVRPADHWRDTHPLGITGLKAVTIAVDDLDEAAYFLAGFLSAEPFYEEARTAIAGRAIGMRVGGSVLELLAPDGAGTIRSHLDSYGPGVRSTVLGVRDVEQARRYFEERHIEVVPGDRPDSVAVTADDNMGVIFEFAA